MPDLAELELRVRDRQVREARQELERLRNSGERVERSAQRMESSFGGLSRAAKALKGTFAALGVGLVIKQLVGAQVQVERLSASMFSATQTVEEAAVAFEFVSKEANRLALDIDIATDGFVKLAAAAEGTALEGKAIEEVFTGVATASSALQLSASDTSGVLLALNQMISKGTVQSQELKLQLGERLPGAFSVAAESMGVTTAELSKMLEQGQLVTDEFLPRFAALLEQRFAEGAAGAAEGLGANIARLGNAVKGATRAIASSGLGQLMADIVGATAKAVDGFVELGKSSGVFTASNELERIQIDLENAKDEFIKQRRFLARQIRLLGEDSIGTREIKARIDAARDAVVKLNGELVAYRQQAKDSTTEAKEMGEAIEKSVIQAVSFDSFDKGFSLLAEGMQAASQAAEENSRKTKELSNNYESLREELEQQIGDVGRTEKELFTLTNTRRLDSEATAKQRAVIKRLSDELFEHTERIKDNEEVMRRQEEAVRDEIDALMEFDRQQAELQSRQRDFMDNLQTETELLRLNSDEREAQIAIMRAHSLGIKDQDGEIKELIKTQQELRKGTEDTNEALVRMPDIAQATGRGLQSAFRDTFRDIFRDGIDGFKGFFDRIQDLFLNLLAELVASFAASKLVKFLGSAGGIGASGSAMAGGGGSGGGFLSSIGNLFSGGLGGSIAAGGIGIGLGGFANNLIGGNSTFGTVGGTVGSIGGSVLGNILLPGLGGPIGAAAGGFLGSIFGGLFGNQTPPNQSTATAFDFSSGRFNVTTSDPETEGLANEITSFLTQFRDIISQTGATSIANIGVDVGVRDGIQATIDNVLKDTIVAKFDEDDKEGFLRFVVDTILPGFEGLDEEINKLITQFEGTSQELLEFTQTVVSVSNSLPQLRTLFGNQSLQVFTDAAQQMGLGNFNAAVASFATQTGAQEKLLEAQIEQLNDKAQKLFGDLGTTAENFFQDFKKAQEQGLTGEQLTVWLKAAQQLGLLTQAEDKLTASREAAAQATKAAQEAENRANRDKNAFLDDLRVESIEDDDKRASERRLLEFQRKWQGFFDKAAEIGIDYTKVQEAFLADLARHNKREKELLDERNRNLSEAGDQLQESVKKWQFDPIAFGQQLEERRRREQEQITQTINSAMAPQDTRASAMAFLIEQRNSALERHQDIIRRPGNRFSGTLEKLADDIRKFNGQIAQVIRGELSPELVLLREKQKERVDTLRRLHASEKEMLKLEALHAAERTRLNEKLQEEAAAAKQAADREAEAARQAVIQQREAQAQLVARRVEFNRQLQLDLLSFGEGFAAQMGQLINHQRQRLETAREVGANIMRVEQVNALERQRLLENELKRISDPIRGFLEESKFSQDSPLSPTRQLEKSEKFFDRALQSFREGSIESGDLVSAADRLISLSREQFASSAQFNERFKFVNRSLRNALNEAESTTREQFERAAKDDTLKSIGAEISRGNADNVSQLKKLNQQITEMNNVIRNQQRSIDRLIAKAS